MTTRIQTRNAAIVRHYQAGKTTKWLAAKFKLGVRSIQRIVKPYRRKPR